MIVNFQSSYDNNNHLYLYSININAFKMILKALNINIINYDYRYTGLRSKASSLMPCDKTIFDHSFAECNE